MKLLSTQDLRPLIWFRYTDDIFAIWTHGVPALEEFLSSLNEFHDTIKFTVSWSTNSVVFLDMCVQDDLQQIDLHIKSTNTHQYLHTNSSHPKHCKTAIPYSLALRICRLCSEDENMHKRLTDLKQHLRSRGYADQLLEAEIQRASKPSSLTKEQQTTEYPWWSPSTLSFHLWVRSPELTTIFYKPPTS